MMKRILAVLLPAITMASAAQAGCVEDCPQDPVPVTEPGVIGLFALGVASILVIRRLRK